MSNVIDYKSKKVIFRSCDGMPASTALLGGKGAGLVELARLGLPVPASFTISTAIARSYAQYKKLPRRFERQLDWSIEGLEKETGKVFAGHENPLLVSVRSGAAVSMPGMMDTVLNLGLNDRITAGLAERTDKRFAYDCYRRFLSMFGSIVMGVDPAAFAVVFDQVKQAGNVDDDRQLEVGALEEVCDRFCRLIEDDAGRPVPEDPRQQLEMAIVAVLNSWHNDRAVEYRRIHHIANGLGTAVNVVTMVYGNRDETSGTGVVFSRNVVNGSKGPLWGEYLLSAQGEDIVAGTHTPQPIASLRPQMPQIYDRLASIVEMLEERRGHVVDVEFTVESGALYILQVRQAKLTAEAAITIAAQSVFAKKITKEQALQSVTPEQVATVRAQTFAPQALAAALADQRLLAQGLSASPGCAVAKVVLTSEAAVAASQRGAKVILVRKDTCPDDLPGMLAAAGIVTSNGGSTSHAAVVARSLDKPCIVGATTITELEMWDGLTIAMDGQSGMVFRGSLEPARAAEKKEVGLFLRWLRDKECRQWPKPRLVFDYYHKEVPLSDLLYDYYVSDAMFFAARKTKLESKTSLLRMQVHTCVAECIALYLVVACAGEARHTEPYWHETAAEFAALKADFGILFGEPERAAAHLSVVQRLKVGGLAEHIRCMELCLSVFQKGRWGGAFGGPKWASITQAALSFLKGELSHSVFADHAFDLQHNGGCVFGKNSMIEASSSYLIRQKLDLKKNTKGVADLHHGLRTHYRTTTSEVEQLFHEGVKLGLWQDSKGRETVSIDKQFEVGHLVDDGHLYLSGGLNAEAVWPNHAVESYYVQAPAKVNLHEHLAHDPFIKSYIVDIGGDEHMHSSGHGFSHSIGHGHTHSSAFGHSQGSKLEKSLTPETDVMVKMYFNKEKIKPEKLIVEEIHTPHHELSSFETYHVEHLSGTPPPSLALQSQFHEAIAKELQLTTTKLKEETKAGSNWWLDAKKADSSNQ